MLISKKLYKFDKKIRRKMGELINKKPPKLDKKIRKKTNHLLFYKG